MAGSDQYTSNRPKGYWKRLRKDAAFRNSQINARGGDTEGNRARATASLNTHRKRYGKPGSRKGGYHSGNPK